MKITTIIFDFDGVLAESVSVKGDAFCELYKSEEQDIQSAVLKYHQENGGVSRYDKIRYYEIELCKRSANDAQVHEIAQKFSEIVEQRVIKSAWVRGAKNFLEQYYKKIPLYIASATPEEELKRIVTSRDMGHYFKGIFGTPTKKHEHINAIIKQENVSASTVVMIGDAITDHEAAQKNQTNFIGRRLGNEGLIFPKGTKMINDLSELETCLKSF